MTTRRSPSTALFENHMDEIIRLPDVGIVN